MRTVFLTAYTMREMCSVLCVHVYTYQKDLGLACLCLWSSSVVKLARPQQAGRQARAEPTEQDLLRVGPRRRTISQSPAEQADGIQEQQTWRSLAHHRASREHRGREVEGEKGGGKESGRKGKAEQLTEPPGTCLYSRLSPNVYFGPDWRPTGCNWPSTRTS